MAIDRLTRRTDRGMTSSIKIVVAVAAVVFIACICIMGWRILAWRKRRAAANAGSSVEIALPTGSSSAASAIEKGFLPETIPSTVDTTIMEPSSAAQTKRSTRPKLPPIPVQAPAVATQPGQPLPPPAYVENPPKAYQPPVIRTSTPLHNVNVNEPRRSEVLLESPIRKSSFRPPMVKSSPNQKSTNKKLPRLMTVGATYAPTLSDELPIKVGEIVRMIEEYEDEWCLVQQVGRTDDEKGVCPRFCLLERQDIIPRQKKGPMVSFPVSTSAFPVSTYYK